MGIHMIMWIVQPILAEVTLNTIYYSTGLSEREYRGVSLVVLYVCKKIKWF